MSLKFADLWSWRGRIDRHVYLLVGTVLLVAKYGLDRTVASLFHRSWSPLNYLQPGEGLSIASLRPENSPFYGALLALALPFIWIGVVLTLKRLRDAALPLWLLGLFFVPAFNLIFFLILSLIPSREAGAAPTIPSQRRPSLLDRLLPAQGWGSAVAAVLLPVPLGLGATLLAVSVLKQYGWGLFIGLPFALGLASVLLYGYRQPRPYGRCALVAATTNVVLGVVLLATAREGAICLVMAAPLYVVLGVMGGSVGYAIQRHPRRTPPVPPTLLGLLLVVPGLMGAERAMAPRPPVSPVRTTVMVDAPPQRVWHNVVTFNQIPPPREWLFRVGIAYPRRAVIKGHGPGAVRHCVFSTGPFIEPIQVWDEPRLLKFSVTENPPPLEEWTPYRHIDPPHRHGFLVSHGGQFLLTPLANGRTRLEGTTWYSHSMWPAPYWKLWADAIIHRIHLRVLNHVKQLSEEEERKQRESPGA